jgi:hypothetical protein
MSGMGQLKVTNTISNANLRKLKGSSPSRHLEWMLHIATAGDVHSKIGTCQHCQYV